MRDLKIVIEDDFVISDGSDNIMTTFYIDYQGKSFPDNQWTDLTNAVLGMWEHTLLAHKNSYNVKFQLYFMDGAYRFDVSRGNDQQITVKCINSRKNEYTDFIFRCSYFDFFSAIYDAAKRFNYLLFINNMHRGRFELVYNQMLVYQYELKKALSECSE